MIQRHLRAVLDQIPIGVVVAEAPSGRLVLANRQVEENWRHGVLFSGAVEEYDQWRGFHPDGGAYEPDEWPLARALRTGEIVVDEDIEILRGDGTRGVIEVSATPVRDSDGRIVAAVAVSRDVTARKRRERNHRTFVEFARVVAAGLDEESTLRELARAVVGHAADCCVVDLLGSDQEVRRVEVAHRDPDAEEEFQPLFDYPPDLRRPEGVGRVLRTGESLLERRVSEQDIRRNTGTEEHLRLVRRIDPRSAIIVPLRVDRRILGALTLISSLEGRHYDRQDLEWAERLGEIAAVAVRNARRHRELEVALERQQEMDVVVSHDLRDPLNTIRMASHLLRDEDLPDRARSDLLGAIERAVALMDGLIGDLHEAQGMRAGELRLELKPVDFRSLLDDVRAATGTSADRAGIELSFRIEGSPPVIDADSERLFRVLANLVSNALKFTPEGGRVEVRTRAVDDRIRFQVTDTGPGISPEEQERIFDRFWKGDHGRQGTGLGLWIARSIIEAHGGGIELESTLGEGTTFSFWIPA